MLLLLDERLLVVMDDVELKDGCLDKSQGHLAVHLFFSDPIAVPVDEEEDGPRPSHLSS